jgi:hypothetical protein
MLSVGIILFGCIQSLSATRMVQVSAPEIWGIREAQMQAEDRLPPRGAFGLARVGGKEIVFPAKGAEWIQTVLGNDGSVYIRREHRQMVWTNENSIWHDGQERPIDLDVVRYINRFNYAGTVALDSLQAPEASLDSAAVVNGERQALGNGRLKHWNGRDLAVLEDATLTSSGPNLTIVEGKRRTQLCGSVFLRSLKSGTLAFAGDGRLSLWTKGRFYVHWILPPRWTIVGIAPAGWALVREEDSETNWCLGVLDAGVIKPIQFRRPVELESLRWQEGSEVFGRAALRFIAFDNDTVKCYRLARK